MWVMLVDVMTSFHLFFSSSFMSIYLFCISPSAYIICMLHLLSRSVGSFSIHPFFHPCAVIAYCSLATHSRYLLHSIFHSSNLLFIYFFYFQCFHVFCNLSTLICSVILFYFIYCNTNLLLTEYLPFTCHTLSNHLLFLS